MSLNVELRRNANKPLLLAITMWAGAITPLIYHIFFLFFKNLLIYELPCFFIILLFCFCFCLIYSELQKARDHISLQFYLLGLSLWLTQSRHTVSSCWMNKCTMPNTLWTWSLYPHCNMMNRTLLSLCRIKNKKMEAKMRWKIYPRSYIEVLEMWLGCTNL